MKTHRFTIPRSFHKRQQPIWVNSASVVTNFRSQAGNALNHLQLGPRHQDVPLKANLPWKFRETRILRLGQRHGDIDRSKVAPLGIQSTGADRDRPHKDTHQQSLVVGSFVHYRSIFITLGGGMAK